MLGGGLYLTNFDYVLVRPGRFDRAESAFASRSKLPIVPVIRAFGATRGGQRCCVHVHNVYPYCYVEYTQALVPDVVLPYIQRLGNELNRAFAAAANQPTREMQLVAAIHLCKGMPFYGYTETPHYYLKISYVDPALRMRLASILESGRVMETKFQPIEAHVQYHLQFMLDYNLSGCDYMELDQLYFRGPWPPEERGGWNEASIPHAQKTDLPRDTYSELEGDAEAHHIANRRTMREAHGKPEAQDEPLVPSLRGLWVQERMRRQHAGLSPTPERSAPFPRTDPSDTPWVAAERHAAQLAVRVEEDATEEEVPDRGMEKYVLDAYQTPELFHAHGLERVAPPDASGTSAKIFDLQHAQSQGSQETPTLHTAPSQSLAHETSLFLSSSSHSGHEPSHTEAPPPRAPRKRKRTSHTPHQAQKGWYAYRTPAPTKQEVMRSFAFFGLPDVEYTPCHFSRASDVPALTREYANKAFTIPSSTLAHMPLFAHWPERRERSAGGMHPIPHWQIAQAPPSAASVRAWLTHHELQPTPALLPSSQIPLPRITESQTKTPVLDIGRQHMTTLALQVIVPTRADLVPDARQDAIDAVVYTLMQDAEPDASEPYIYETGLVYVSSPRRLGLAGVTVHYVDTELELLNMLVDIVRALDPEILTAYDVHRGSWAYVAERASLFYEYDLLAELGRARRRGGGSASVDQWTATHASALRVQGRHVLNIWRMMQGEVALTQYTLENVVYHILHRRIPHYDHATLTTWLRSERASDVVRALTYTVRRVRFALELLEKSELLFRTAEFARMYGIDFFSVLSRGSQFRVESVLLRITKLQSYLLPSPNREQVGQQNAAECVPLVLEPQSAFYRSPLLVLDFQSLYPSMMIAYNICYSTCLGRLVPFQGTYKLGFIEHAPPPGAMRRLANDVQVLPNGIVMAKRSVRESTLARMLREVLETRVMVRTAMRAPGVNKAMARRYQAQQLSLKLLANVTYGYTGASASGRMPCVEIADAIVQSGRETLERAMNLIEQTEEWGGEVVYGDTDSLFVSLPGKSKEQAFAIGRAISEAVTKMNPEPVKLNFEKVYLPCVLVAKKRYVGYKFESPSQLRPVLDVKGLEIIRRDGFVALQRMQEACVRILFDTQDLTLVKQYCQRQWSKIYAGLVSPLHLVTAKAVRLGSYSGPNLPPGAALSARGLLHDTQRIPHSGERIPYLLRHGLPNTKLSDLAVSPRAVLADPGLRLYADHYIRRLLVPALSRIFNLVGVDVQTWVDEMPRSRTMVSTRAFSVEACAVCGQATAQYLCQDCARNPEQTLHRAASELNEAEARQAAIHTLCSACADDGSCERPPCVSLDCPVSYTRAKNDAAVHERSARLAHALENVVHYPSEDPWVW